MKSVVHDRDSQATAGQQAILLIVSRFGVGRGISHKLRRCYSRSERDEFSMTDPHVGQRQCK
jgi:hypothetical protein